jgi:hypothetical protein
MALSLLKAMGGKGAIVVDIDPRKREAAIAAGALGAVDGAAADAVEQIAAKAGGPVYGAIDLVGNEQTAQLGFDCLTKGGKLVMVGLFGGGAPWALPLIAMKALTIQGSYVGNLRETEELLDLVRTKKIPPIPVTTMPLEKADAALRSLKEGKLVGRAVLTPKRTLMRLAAQCGWSQRTRVSSASSPPARGRRSSCWRSIHTTTFRSGSQAWALVRPHLIRLLSGGQSSLAIVSADNNVRMAAAPLGEAGAPWQAKRCLLYSFHVARDDRGETRAS